jgi:hypothetical protein
MVRLETANNGDFLPEGEKPKEKQPGSGRGISRNDWGMTRKTIEGKYIKMARALVRA